MAAAATKDKEVTKTARVVRQEIVNMAEAIKADMKIDAESGVATVGADLYARLMPEELTPEIVERVQVYNGELASAAALALGESSIPLMKKHKDLRSTTLVIPATGRDTLGVTFEQSRQVSAGIVEKGQPAVMRDKFGHTHVEFRMQGNHKRGDLKAVFETLEAKAAKALGK